MEESGVEDTAVLGPAPLVRTDPASNQLRLQPEGLEILRHARSPVHIVFAIGGSRCGKSTASNALAFGAGDKDSRFTTGDTFDPVTEGVDVAFRQLPEGGSLIVADCEGAFHACGSAHSARGFGTLGLLAYRMSTALLHVSMGSIDERDIEAIGFLAAHGSGCPDGGVPEPGSEDSEEHILPPMQPGTAPSFFLLVNGARFNLGDAVAKKLLRVPDDGGLEAGRNSARHAIARGFHGSPALEALPAIEHAAYWPKVNALRQRIIESAPITLKSGALGSGADVVDRLSALVAGLNGESPSAVLAREPQAATEALYRSLHLEPLVEELSRRFAATGAAAEERAPRLSASDTPTSPTRCALEDILVEFDRRTAWLSGGVVVDAEGTESEPGSALLRPEALLEVRTRLSSRLNGIREALAKGRKQGAQARPSRSRGRPSSLTGTPCSNEKENVSPTPPGTPTRKNLTMLEAALAEVEGSLQQLLSLSETELEELRVAVAVTSEEVERSTYATADADRQAGADVQALHEHFQSCLRGLTEASQRRSSEEATTAGALVAELQGELLSLGDRLPEAAAQCGAQIAEVRDAIEAQRIQRQEAGNEAAQVVEGRLKALREELSEEAAALEGLKEDAPLRFLGDMQELQGSLKEETAQRKNRHAALREVVQRLSLSLEVSAEPLMGEAAMAKLHRTPPRTPVNSKIAATTPAAPVILPGQEAPRMARSGLWSSGATTPTASRSGTPRRTALPAPPSMSGREW